MELAVIPDHPVSGCSTCMATMDAEAFSQI